MPGFLDFWGNLIRANVFAFQASEILGKVEPGHTLATSDAKIWAGIVNFTKIACPRIPHSCQGLIVIVLLF